MVSIIITERERFRFVRESLDSILAHPEGAREILYVSGLPPTWVVSLLERTRRKRKGFKHLVLNRYLGSNEACAIGLKAARPGNDLVFVENDVFVRKGWVSRMVRCAKETGADIVMPMVFEGGPEDGPHRVHDAGSFLRGKAPRLGLEYVFRGLLPNGRGIERQSIDVVEMHTVFIRRKFMKGWSFDEKVGEVGHPFEFSLECRRRGAKIFLEPSAQVVFANTTLLPHASLEDLRFFLFKFNERGARESVRYISRKWSLDPGSPLFREKRSWAMAYKGAVFASFGILGPWEKLAWRAARLRIFPDWWRILLEKYLTARILTGAAGKLSVPQGGSDGRQGVLKGV